MEKYVVMDWTGVRFQDYKILLLSIPFFVLYAQLLIIVSSIGEALVTGLLFLFTQLIIGMTTTRKYYQFGSRAKEQLSFLDPSSLSNGWRVEEREIHSEEISRIFENFYKSINDADKKSTDDINDVAWFIIAVWSMFSTLVAVTLELFFPFCLMSSGVLATIGIITYYEGRKGRNNGYFEDAINHLEYYVISRLEGIVALHHGAHSFVLWKVKNNTAVLNDFCVSINLELSEKVVVKYYLGLPSREYERIIIETDVAEEKIRNVISEGSGWQFNVLENNQFEIYKSDSNLDLRYRGSYVRTPQKPEILLETIKKVLKVIS